jgi:PAS domain S-box-containing protein
MGGKAQRDKAPLGGAATSEAPCILAAPMASERSQLTGDHYRLLVENAPVLLWRARTDGGRDYVNERWLAFTGRPVEQELGDGWRDGIHAEDRERCLDVQADHLRRRSAFEVEYRLRRRDGVYRRMVDCGVPFESADGIFGGFIGSCVDVEDRRQIERAKATFLGLLAHEIRTPLTSIRAFSEVVRRRVARGERVDLEIFGRLDQQVDAVAELTRDLSDAALREIGGELALALAPIDLADVVRDGVARFMARLGRTVIGRISFDVNLAVGEMPMHGDRARLGQLVRHILDNAVKFMPRGGTVQVTLTTDGAHHRLSVRDEGIGVREEDLPRLTEPYFRGGNVDAEHYPGVGLGLSLSRDVVERHSGELRITSTLDVGTIVEVVLPARRR